jgi:hypothetical protein
MSMRSSMRLSAAIPVFGFVKFAIRAIENSQRSAQQPKFHSLPMTTISWRIEI